MVIFGYDNVEKCQIKPLTLKKKEIGKIDKIFVLKILDYQQNVLVEVIDRYSTGQ